MLQITFLMKGPKFKKLRKWYNNAQRWSTISKKALLEIRASKRVRIKIILGEPLKLEMVIRF